MTQEEESTSSREKDKDKHENEDIPSDDYNIDIGDDAADDIEDDAAADAQVLFAEGDLVETACGEEGEDAPVSDKDMYKVNKGVKGKNTYRYIYFKQPGCLAQFKKRLLMATCCLPTEELEVEAKVSSKANETPETEVASSSPEANEIRQEKETEKRRN